MLHTWLDPLKRAIQAEFSDRPISVALATTRTDGSPSVRMMILRRLTDDGALLLTTDHRSEKIAHLHKTNTAEVLFWFQERREQFRVYGPIHILDSTSKHPLRAEIWQYLSEATRATFSPASTGEVPDTFDVLQLNPHQVERLQLNPTPHDRRRWSIASGWAEQQIVP